MGWLRDLMLRSEPPVASLGDLARKALAHADWPKGSTIRERSLATLLSKLDRGQELDWLRDRPEEMDVLAKALGRPSSEVSQLLGDSPVRRDRRMFRFHDLRYARDLDLVREDLAPGFAPELKHPVHWTQTLVWLAPSGAGRALLGAWLEARGLAQVCRLSGPNDKIPPYGALFVDLAAARELSDKEFERLKRYERPLCIAVARLSQVADVLPEAQVIEAAKPSEYLTDLAHWVGSRVGQEGHFDADRAAAWLRRSILPNAPLQTWGETLGLLGLFDEIPSRDLARADLAQTLRLFVQRRIKETQNLPFVRPDEVFGRLVTATARRLTEGGDGMSGPRSLEGWLEALGDTAPQAERSSRHEGLSAHQLFRALLSANLLRREWLPLDAPDAEHYSLGPHCLVALLHSLALDDVFRAPVDEWGQALLNARGHKREFDLMRRLVRQATEGNLAAHYEVLEGIDNGGPKDDAFVCALEASVESLGIAALHGSVPPADLCQEILREYSKYLVKVGDQLETRLREPEPVLAGYLALCLESAGAKPELDPIQNEQSRLLLGLTERLFSWALVRPLKETRAPRELSVGATLTALSRAWRARGGVSESLPHPEHATLTLLVTPERMLPAQGLAIVAIEHLPFNALEHSLTLEGRDLGPFYRAVWQELLLAEPKALAHSINLRRHLSTASPAFYRALPEAALNRPDLESLIRFELLLPHQLETRIRNGPCPLPGAAVLSGPLDVALDRLDREGPELLGHDAIQALYERSAKLTTRALLRRVFEGGDARGLHEISAHHQLHTIMPELPATPELVHRDSGLIDALRLALLEITRTSLDPATRRSAYERLDQLEAAILGV